MKNLGTLLLASLCLTSTSIVAQNTVVLIEEDFESGGGNLNTGNGGAVVTQVADPDPAGTNGTVAAVDIGAGGEWGEIRTAPDQNNPLPGGAQPGVETVTASIDVYIDSDTTTYVVGEAADSFNLILRFNAGVDVAGTRVALATNSPWEGIPADQWNTIVVTGIIPATDTAGTPITHVLPIISLRDQDNNGLPGTAAFIDNFRLEFTVPDDDPNLGVAITLDFGQVTQGEGSVTSMLTLSNTGSAETLTVSGANLSGADAGLFAIVGDPFPLDIAPGASADIELSFDPGVGLGSFSATLELASNDENDPSLSVALEAESLPPFGGEELIINGDFELGSLTAWRDNDRFNYVTEPTHTGDGAAAFNLQGGNQWGEARLDAPSPPTLIDDSQAIAITPEMIGKPYEYSAWYYRPSVGAMAANDTCQTILRWNKNNTAAHSMGFFVVGSIPVDTWVEVTGSGVVPEVGGDGAPTTSVVPLWSFRDVDIDAAGGELMYIDSVSLKIEGPQEPDPLVISEISVDEKANSVSLTWNAVLGATYALDRTTDVSGSWAEQEDSIIADSEEYTHVDGFAPLDTEARLFYRVRLVELP